MLATLAAVVLVVMFVALAAMGRTGIDRARAQTAADAAALASVTGGREAAADLAADHGAVLVSWARGAATGDVLVTVRIGDATATASASDRP